MYLTTQKVPPNPVVLRSLSIATRMPKQEKLETKKSVLIVEDSIDFSNLLKFLVEDQGLEGVQYPLNDADIVAWVKERQPSLILMDLALRRKSGMDYINELKNDPSTKNIPVIIISGRDLGHKEVLELEIRGVKYLRKGRVEMDDIKKAIKVATHAKAPTAGTEGNE